MLYIPDKIFYGVDAFSIDNLRKRVIKEYMVSEKRVQVYVNGGETADDTYIGTIVRNVRGEYYWIGKRKSRISPKTGKLMG